MPEKSAAIPGKKSAISRGGVFSRLLVGIAVLAAAGVAIWFLGDVPNRYRASRAMHDGRVALLASDLPTALRFFRAAALARPTDEAIVQQYDQTQTRWVDMVSEKLAKLDPEEGYLALQGLPPIEPLLVEPHLSRFRTQAGAIAAAARAYAEQRLATANDQVAARQFDAAYATLKAVEPLRALVPDLPARVQAARDAQLAAGMAAAQDALKNENFADARAALQAVAALGSGHEDYQKLGPAIDEAEVRAILRDVTAAVEKNDFATAAQGLARATELKVLTAEVAKAQTALRDQARVFFALELARGLATDQRATVEAALAGGRLYAGWESIAADRLLQPATLPDFVAALETCGLGPKAMATYLDRLDLPIVLHCRAKFSADAVEAFLRDGYAQWSRYAAQANFPGLALYLDDQAQAHGAAAAEAWRQAVLAQAIESTHVTVAVADPEPDPEAPDGLDEAATAALRSSLKAKLTAWPKYVDLDPAHPPTIVFRGACDGFASDDDDSDVVKKTVRYQSGTRQVRNADEQSLHEEYDELMERRNNLVDSINEKQAFVDQVNGNPNADDFTRSQARDRAIDIATDRMLVSQWDRKLDDLRRRGRSLPAYLNEPVYSDESYKIIRHVYTCSLGWQITALLHGDAQDVTSPRAETTFRTEEVAGNAAHGVPVRAPQPVPRARLTKELVPALVAKVGDVGELLRQLPALTLRSFVAFHQKTVPINRADQFAALAYAWKAQKQALPGDAETKIFAYAREVLSLP